MKIPTDKKSKTEVRQDKNKELLLEQLRRTPIVQIACEKIGIARATYYRFLEDPEFAKKADEAIREGSYLMNDVAEAALLSAIKSQNLSAIVFWLKNHHPAYTTRVELSGRITHVETSLTPEEQELVREALRLALPQRQGDLSDQTHE
ncbi:hypothetical protein HYZ98_01830 [Candidatus Peregrinibacteria bacterium]|nr:hypothetical protein [Candidatus Peregrinibacteria bacterium]